MLYIFSLWTYWLAVIHSLNEDPAVPGLNRNTVYAIQVTLPLTEFLGNVVVQTCSSDRLKKAGMSNFDEEKTENAVVAGDSHLQGDCHLSYLLD